MKYIFLALLLIGCTDKANSGTDFEAEQNKALAFARNLNIGDCFRYESDRKAKFSFEKDYRAIDNIHMVIAKDPKGLLIAQPDPKCKFPSDESHKCDYWFRTVPFDDLYLFHADDKKLTCPSELSVLNMIERLKKSPESKQFNF